jgi:anti-sigma B factor antagonist
MEISTKSQGDILIIKISGRMDSISSAEVEEKLNDAIDDNKCKIIIDLEAVEYISTGGLRVLLAALKKQKEKGGSIELVSLQPFVRNIFKIIGFDRIFSILPSKEEAVSSFIQESVK